MSGETYTSEKQNQGISAELIRRIKGIELYTRHLVANYFGGEYLSAFKGQGMEFAEVRPYEPGDDVRDIDWNVTARLGQPFIKKYMEERELLVFFLVDISASQNFGGAEASKRDLTTELAATLAFSAVSNNDKVGAVLFSDRVEKYLPPRKGRQSVLRVLRELLYCRPRGRGTDINGALGYLQRVCHKRGVIFLISDFQDAGWERALKTAARRHEVIGVSVADPLETKLAGTGMFLLSDAEGETEMVVDAGDRGFGESMKRLWQGRQEELRRTFQRLGLGLIEVNGRDGYVKELLRFFKGKKRRA